jgi:hypothetical protein
MVEIIVRGKTAGSVLVGCDCLQFPPMLRICSHHVVGIPLFTKIIRRTEDSQVQIRSASPYVLVELRHAEGGRGHAF